MEAPSNNMLKQSNENRISKYRGQSTFKIYYGIKRKEAITTFIRQRRWLKKRMITENKAKDELLYCKDHYALEGVNGNEISQCEEDFSKSSMNIAEIEAKEFTENNFKFTHYQEKKERETFSNDFPPVQRSNLHRAFYTHEQLGLPRMAILLPRSRKASTQKRSLSKWIIAENGEKENESSQCGKDFSAEIKAIESKDNFLNSLDLTPSQRNFQSHKSKAFSKEFKRHAISNLHRAFHTYEHLGLPRMAIVRQRPQGRTVKIEHNDNILASPYMHTKLPSKDEIWCLEKIVHKKLILDQIQKILDIIESLRSLDRTASRSHRPLNSTKPKYNLYYLFMILPLVILTIVVFYFIWTLSLPAEILVTFSGMYISLMSYIYFLVNGRPSK